MYYGLYRTGFPRVGATCPALTSFIDCRVAMTIVLKVDHEGSPLRIVTDRIPRIDKDLYNEYSGHSIYL
jgi:hypothetical protein